MSKRVSATSIAPTTKRMTSMINLTPPRRSIRIVKSLLTLLRRSIRIMKFRACAGAA